MSLTLPGKVQSYMAAGKPIIGAIDGETKMVIEDAQCGLCGKANNPEELADNIKKFIMKDTDRNVMGQNARKYYEKYYDQKLFMDKLENELTKEIYKSSSKIINCLNRIKLPEMKEFSSEKIYDYIDIIIEDYENIKENAYLVVPQINYTMDLNIEDSSSEELLSDNTLEKDENSPDNGFEVGEYNTYEAYNSEKQYFTREDYTYDYDLLNAI